MILNDLRRPEDAKEALESALKILGQEYNDDNIQIATTLHNLGVEYKNLGELEKAKYAYNRALNIFKQLLPQDHPKVRMAKKFLDRFLAKYSQISLNNT